MPQQLLNSDSETLKQHCQGICNQIMQGSYEHVEKTLSKNPKALDGLSAEDKECCKDIINKCRALARMVGRDVPDGDLA